MDTARRSADARTPSLVRRLLPQAFHTPQQANTTLNPVLAGRMLLVATGATVTATVPFLARAEDGWPAFLIVSAAIMLFLLGSIVIRWERLPRSATLAFPGAVCSALCGISLVTPGLLAPLSGILTLCFAYIGLTQRPGMSIASVPFASLTLILINGGLTRETAVKLSIGVAVWILLAEILARLTSSNAKLLAAMDQAAHTDALTGIANRRDLDSRIALATPSDSVVLCDLDHFKQLNDDYGHLVGDQVLADFGALLRTELRAIDYCARYGGEEFLLLLPTTTPAEAARVVVRLQDRWQTLRPGVTFSAGVAACRAGRPHTATIDAADVALYAAKVGGRNTYRLETDAVEATVEPAQSSRGGAHSGRLIKQNGCPDGSANTPSPSSFLAPRRST